MGLHLLHQPFHAECGDLQSATAQYSHGLFSKTVVKNISSFNLAPHPFETAQLWAIYARVNRRPVFIRTGKSWTGERTGCSPPKALGTEWLTIKLRLVWEWMCTPEYRKVTKLHCIFTASALIPARALPSHFHWESNTCKEFKNLSLNFQRTFAVCIVHSYMQLSWEPFLNTQVKNQPKMGISENTVGLLRMDWEGCREEQTLSTGWKSAWQALSALCWAGTERKKTPLVRVGCSMNEHLSKWEHF